DHRAAVALLRRVVRRRHGQLSLAEALRRDVRLDAFRKEGAADFVRTTLGEDLVRARAADRIGVTLHDHAAGASPTDRGDRLTHRRLRARIEVPTAGREVDREGAFRCTRAFDPGQSLEELVLA